MFRIVRYNANGLLSSISSNEGTTSLTWDILMGEGVVISANTNGVETDYTIGLERISAQTGKRKPEYVYDGRGSVAAELSYNTAWYKLGGILSSKDVLTKSHTPFGEQIGKKTSGFGYNGEYYNAATGMVYLRARFYEPEMSRFNQKDIIRGAITEPGSLNRYLYVQNDPINFIDPSGESLRSAWNKVTSTVKSAVTTVVNTVKSAVNTVKTTVNNVVNAAKSAYNKAATAISNAVSKATSSTGTSSSSGYSSTYTGGSSYSGGSSYTATTLQVSTFKPYDSNGNATSYYNSSYQSGKIPSPDAPQIKDIVVDATYCNSIDVASIFKSQFAQYGSAFTVLGTVAVGDLSPLGETAYAALAIAVTVISVVELGKIVYKGYVDGKFIDLDEDALPRIYADPLPTIHKDAIEKFPLPEIDPKDIIESLPLPDENSGNITSIPLPDEKKDLIVSAGTQSDPNNHMFGENGTQVRGSKTTGQNGPTERIDVENPAPGKRPGDLHYHEANNTKWRYDISIGKFVSPDTGELAPSRVQKVLEETWVKKAINKGLDILGE